MKKIKKIFALLLTFAMILGMSVTAFGANGKPQITDTATLTITGITGNPRVTLYKIAEAEYRSDGNELVDYTWAANIKADNEGNGAYSITTSAPTADQINAIAQGLTMGENDEKEKKIVPLETITRGNLSDADQDGYADYTATVHAGVYIAVLTGASDGSVYNPILLSATYSGPDDVAVDPDGGHTLGNLHVDTINAQTAHYLYGTNAVAKKSEPTIDKEITDGTVGDDKDGDESTVDDKIETAGIGDAVTYEVTVTVPSYPSNATNKTFFISDELSDGLTFDYDSLEIKLGNGSASRGEDNGFTYNSKKIAQAYKSDTMNGFYLNFYYDNLISNSTTGAVYTPIVVTYQAIVNENAKVGNLGNPNDAEFYYANEPNNGETWDEPEKKPDNAAGVYKKEDSETVYTYQLAFQKTGIDTDDDDDKPNPLAGAVFGIYSDEYCNKLIDKVTTNSNGYAVSTKVAKGTYYVKELAPPSGYSLNTTVYKIDARWVTATTTVTGTVTDRTYTTESPSADAVQVGWIKDKVFYALDEMSEETAAENKFQAAYLDSENTTTNTVSSTTTNDAGSGTALLGEKIPNTKLSTLPSTGGIGTTIFTIGGCAIMIAAAGLYFASRRKQENK